MNLIKLDAIPSTNDFLKGLSNKQDLPNFTVVTAENQTKGKGQMGSVWTSEAGKNLILSVLIKDFLAGIGAIYNLNIIVSIAVINVLETHAIPQLSIKWPNDIMSYNKKIGGILIENSIKSDGTILSIVGLGLNVNQTNFDNLPKASSLAVMSGITVERNQLLLDIIAKMKELVDVWPIESEVLWKKYTDKLFKKGVPMPFADTYSNKFMGIIQGVSSVGKLQILLDDESISEFDIKEIEMLY